jgi:hypothetical protein
MILTPYNDPFFQITLETAKLPDYRGGALVVDSETGMIRETDLKGMIEYMYGGEYDLVAGDGDEDE